MPSDQPRQMIYLDHATTSWPKLPQVLRAMTEFLEQTSGSAGRSGHRLSAAAGRCVADTRAAAAGLFGVADTARIVFTLNTTHALNLAIRGLLRPGDRVVTTTLEHNSVMRPLRGLQKEGVLVEVIPCAADGTLDPACVAEALRGRTRLLVATHASNVCGTILVTSQ